MSLKFIMEQRATADREEFYVRSRPLSDKLGSVASTLFHEGPEGVKWELGLAFCSKWEWDKYF